MWRMADASDGTDWPSAPGKGPNVVVRRRGYPERAAPAGLDARGGCGTLVVAMAEHTVPRMTGSSQRTDRRKLPAACPSCGCGTWGPWIGTAERKRALCCGCGHAHYAKVRTQPTPDDPRDRARRGTRIAEVSATGKVTTPNAAADTEAARNALRWHHQYGKLVESDRHNRCSVCSSALWPGRTCWWNPYTGLVTCTTCAPPRALRPGERYIDDPTAERIIRLPAALATLTS